MTVFPGLSLTQREAAVGIFSPPFFIIVFNKAECQRAQECLVKTSDKARNPVHAEIFRNLMKVLLIP